MQRWTEAAFVGGHPALDFLNTVDDHGKSRTKSRIADWSPFLGWAQASRLFSGFELQALKAVKDKAARQTALAEIHELRETAYRVLAAIAAGTEPASRDWDELERVIKSALSRASLASRDGSCRWRAQSDGRHGLIDTLALSLESLLRTEDLARLRQCGRCTWLFLNRGRGPGRRWCDMRTCGNRAKSDAFRKR